MCSQILLKTSVGQMYKLFNSKNSGNFCSLATCNDTSFLIKRVRQFGEVDISSVQELAHYSFICYMHYSVGKGPQKALPLKVQN